MLLDLELILHMFLPEVIDLFGLFVHLDFTLGDLVDQLLGLALHVGDELNFLDVFLFEDLNLNLHLLVFISLNDQSLQKNVDLVDVVKFLEVWLQVLIQNIVRLLQVSR